MSIILKSHCVSISTTSKTLFTAPPATTVVALSGGVYNSTSGVLNLTLSIVKHKTAAMVTLVSNYAVPANGKYLFPAKIVLESEDKIVGRCSAVGTSLNLNYSEQGDIFVDVSVANAAAIAASNSAGEAALSAQVVATYANYIDQGVKTSDTPEFSGLTIGGNPVTSLSFNDIGVAGKQGFGVGVCPTGFLPPGFNLLPGTETMGHNNYGNYQFRDGSICVYVPLHWLKIGSGFNSLPVNQFSILKYSAFPDEATANASGYFIPRAFKDGGETKLGYFVDKYQASKNAYGTGYVASSIKNGNPISTHVDHNPISELTACTANAIYEAINAAHARDGEDGAVNPNSNWFCSSRFIFVNLAQLSMAHGQAATSTTSCAWYDPAGVTNFPKGCNNDALGDTNDASILYTSDGYSNCGKTGSGLPFAKTTHNGQACGITDLNGNIHEISLGVTSDGTNYYVVGEWVEMKDFSDGNLTSTDHWGATGIAANMETLDVPYIQSTTGDWSKVGSGSNQVFSESLTGNGALLRSIGMPKDEDGQSDAGINQFGQDGIYNFKLRNELCVLSGLYWDNSSKSGVWGVGWNNYRSSSYFSIGFRCACYPVQGRDSGL